MVGRSGATRPRLLILAASAGLLSIVGGARCETDTAPPALTGRAAYGDWTTDAPGVRRRLTPADLPPPYATRSAADSAQIVPRPANALPQVPPRFKVEQFVAGLDGPRLLRTAPNGDIFIAETGAGRIRVLAANGGNREAGGAIYAKGLDEPFGLAFYPPGPDPQYLYVGTVNAVLRFAYRNGDTAASGQPAVIVPDLPEGGHRTRDVLFSPDGRTMFVSVGSLTNVQEGVRSVFLDESRRADILAFDPEGRGERRFATGMRNPIQMAIHPLNGDLWAVVNERDGLGDDLPPDYVTRVREGAFYGWPWYYIGANEDPHHKGEHPDLRDRVMLPDVLIQPHSAPLGLVVYTGRQFPAAYHNDIFVALHGSWNRARRTGYKVVRVLLRDGKPTGEYEDFLTGLVTPAGEVWARPVGLTVAADGALLVSDDANGTIWRVSHVGEK
jgi:glucose/arabinose dehydrogenase